MQNPGAYSHKTAITLLITIIKYICQHAFIMRRGFMTASTSPVITKDCRYCIFLSAGIASFFESQQHLQKFFGKFRLSAKDPWIRQDWYRRTGTDNHQPKTSAAGARNPGMISQEGNGAHCLNHGQVRYFRIPSPDYQPIAKENPDVCKLQASGARYRIAGHYKKVSTDPAASARSFLSARENNQAFPALFSSR